MSNDAHPVNIKIEDGKFPGDKEWLLMCSESQEDKFRTMFGWEIEDKRNLVNASKATRV